MPGDPRWEGRVEAQLEALQNEMLPLKPLPGHMALVANTVERMERALKEDRQQRADRDEAQDQRLASIERKLDKSTSRRNLLLGLVPVFVALITTAGFLLKG